MDIRDLADGIHHSLRMRAETYGHVRPFVSNWLPIRNYPDVMTGNEALQFCVLFNAEAETSGWPMRSDANCHFSDERLQRLHAVWQEKAATAPVGVPTRNKLDMRTLKPFMRNIAILELVEVDGGHSYRFRLFGSALAMVFGEHTGRLIDEMVLPSTLTGWIAFYDMVLSTRVPMLLENFFRADIATTYLKGELLAAPLTDDAGQIRYVLAATYVDMANFAPPPFSSAGPLSA